MTATATNVTATRVDNGVNVEALLGARQALTDAPQAAQFKWRATCTWINGTHSHSTVQSFFGLGAEQSLACCEHVFLLVNVPQWCRREHRAPLPRGRARACPR